MSHIDTLARFMGDATVHRLGWSLVHFLWQGAVIGAFVAAVLIALRRASANTRYLAACCGLLLMVASPIVTFLVLPQPEIGEATTGEALPSVVDGPEQSVAVAPSVPVQSLVTEVPPTLAEPAEPVAAPMPRESLAPAHTDASAAGVTSQSLWTRVDEAIRPWLTWTVAIWLTGVLLLGLRLMAAWVSVRRLQTRGIQPVVEQWQQHLADLCTRFGIRRTVTLLESALVEVPVVVGWLRPIVLFPACALTGLKSEELQSLLAHELAHVRRYDYLVNVIQTAVETLLFYHPVVWWVSHRIRSEREHCCDDLAVKVLGDRLTYARALSHMAELGAAPSLATAASGGSLLTRIRRVMRLDPNESTRPAGWLPATVVLVTLAALAAVVLAPLGSSSETAAQTSDEQANADKDSTPAESTIVTGLVVTPAGEPAQNARVDVVGRLNDLYSDPTPFGHATTDEAGRFQIDMRAASSASLFKALVYASGDGFGMAWAPLNLDAASPNVTVRLLPERLIRGQLVDLEGKPANGIKVHLTNVGAPSATGRTEWAMWMHDPVAGLSVWPHPAVTDDEGRFEVWGVGEGVDARLQVRDEPFARESILVKADQREPVSAALAPAQVVVGTVISEETGEPIPHARITVDVGFDRENKHRGTGINGTTDEAGRFRMNPYPGNAYYVTAFPPAGRELNQRREIRWPTGAPTQQLELKLPTGVLLRGRVTQSGTGKPVAGAGIEFRPRTTGNPNLRDDVVTGWEARVWTGADGQFTMPVLPGPGHLLINGPTSHYVFHEIGSTTISSGKPGGVRTYAHAIVPLDIEAETRAHAVQTELQRGTTVRGRLVDPAGEPVEEAKMLWRYPRLASEHEFRGFGTVVRDGVFELHGLADNRSYPVVFLDAERNLGAAVEISGESEPLVVRLERCGSAVGRFVNARGEPLVEFAPSLCIVITPGPSLLSNSSGGGPGADETLLANFDRANYWDPPKTDRGGRCEFPALVPGADYRFLVNRNDQLIVTKTFRVESGETRDLGEIRIDVDPEVASADPAATLPADSLPQPAADVSIVEGRVLNADGKPAANARIYYLPAPSARGMLTEFRQLSVADADGRFRVEIPKIDFHAPSGKLPLVAVADGHGLDWIQLTRDGQPEQVTLNLVKDQVVRGRLLDSEGRPAVNATIEVNMLFGSSSGSMDQLLAAWRRVADEAVDTTDHRLYGPLTQLLQISQPDENGAFEVRGLGKERLASVVVTGANIAQNRLHVLLREGLDTKRLNEAVAKRWPMMVRPGRPPVLFGTSLEYVGEPGRTLSGSVRTKKDGPVAGATITIGGPGGLRSSVTDSDGRFTFHGLSKTRRKYQLEVTPDRSSDLLPRSVQVKARPGLRPLTADIELVAGVVVTGRVIDGSNGNGVPASVNFAPLPNNKHLGAGSVYRSYIPSRFVPNNPADGSFRLVTVPGAIVLLARSRSSDVEIDGQRASRYKQAVLNEKDRALVTVDSDASAQRLLVTARGWETLNLYEAVAVLNVEKDDTASVDLQLEPGETIDVQIEDANGNPLTGALVSGMTAVSPTVFRAKQAQTTVYALDPNKPRRIVFHHEQRKLSGNLLVRGDEQQPLKVRLMPTASIIGRALDEKGRPAAGLEVSLMFRDRTVQDLRSRLRLERDPVQTADDGRFVLEGVPRGLSYRLVFTQPENMRQLFPKKTWSTVGADTNVKQVDLGDLRLSDDSSKLEPGPKADAVPIPDDGQIKVTGRVLKPDGSPASNAVVLVGLPDARGDGGIRIARPVSQRVEPDGGFEVSFSPSQLLADPKSVPPAWMEQLSRAIQVVATMRGFGPAAVHLGDHSSGDALQLQLVENEPVEGKFVDLEGKPVKNLRVRVEGIEAAPDEQLDPWLSRLRAGKPIWDASRERKHRTIAPNLVGYGNELRIGLGGKLSIDGIGRDRVLRLVVVGENVAQQIVQVVTRPIEPLSTNIPADAPGSKELYGSQFRVVVAPSRPVVGTVRDAETQQPLANVPVESYRLTGTQPLGTRNNVLRAVTDEQGRYRLEGVPKGGGNRLLAVPSDNQPYFMREAGVPDAPGLEPVAVDFELHRGVFVSGRVLDASSQEPVPASLYYLPYLSNPHAKGRPGFDDGWIDGGTGYQHRYQTRVDGTFRLVALPGKAIVGALAMARGYRRGAGAEEISGADADGDFATYHNPLQASRDWPNVLREVDIAQDANTFEVKLELDRGDTIKVAVTDAAGADVAGYQMMGLESVSAWSEPADRATFEAPGLSLQRPRKLLIRHASRNIGAVLQVPANRSAGVQFAAKLESCATIRGRVVDADGDPIAGTRVEAVVSPETGFRISLERLTVDDQGRFTFSGIPTGTDYELIFSHNRIAPRYKRFTVTAKPGETKDLGDVRFSNESKPAQPRPADTTDRGPGSPTGPSTVKDRVVKPDGTSIAGADESFHFRARVVDPDGQPVEGARVFYDTYWQRTGPTELARTGADGWFDVEIDPASGNHISMLLYGMVSHGGAIVAVADGFGLATMGLHECETTGRLYRAQLQGMPSATPESMKRDLERLMKRIATDPPVFQLVRDDVPITGRVVDIQGQPVAGATISVSGITGLRQGGLDAWEKAASASGAVPPMLLRIIGDDVAGNLPRFVPPVITDENGDFTLQGIGRERVVWLRVAGPRIETSEIFARTRSGDPIEFPTQPRTPASEKRVYHPASFVHAAGPSEAVIGTVVDAKSKQPLAGVTVQSFQLAGHKTVGWSQRIVRTKTDAEGRYRLEGLPIGENEILALSPIDEPYMLSRQPATTEASSGPLRVDFELTRGVWIQGRVFDLDSGEPIRIGRVEYYALTSNPHAQQAQGLDGAYMANRYRLQPDGTYRIPALAGSGFIGVRVGRPDKYQRGTGSDEIEGKDERLGIFMTYPSYAHPNNFHLLQAIDPDVDAEVIELDFPLSSGRILAVTAVDVDGKTLSGCDYTGKLESASWRRARGETLKVYGYKAEKPRRVQVVHKRQKLAGFLLIEGEEPAELTVTLQPWSEIKGRILDVDGVPQPGVEITSIYEHVQGRSDVAVLPNSSDSSNGAYYADDEARFHIVGLPAGYKFGMDVTEFRKDGDRFGIGRLSPNVELKPGQVHDVGDLRLFYRSRR